MNASEIQKVLDAKVFNEVDEEPEVDFGYSCDLMSDVLAFAQGNDALLTGDPHLSNGRYSGNRVCAWQGTFTRVDRTG